jgi:hypothetical protein
MIVASHRIEWRRVRGHVCLPLPAHLEVRDVELKSQEHT